MSKTGTPIILDSWLCLLNQLSTEKGVLGKDLFNHRGKRYQPITFMFLKDAGLIKTSYGKDRGYRLVYPLTAIPFSVMVNLWSLSNKSYIRRLLLNYGHLSLDSVRKLPVPEKRPTPFSLDSVCHVVRALRYNEFIVPRYFYPTQYTPTYGSLIAKKLKQHNVVIAQPGKGFALLNRQDEINIGDISPVVSNKCQTLSKILLLATDVPVVRLFK